MMHRNPVGPVRLAWLLLAPWLSAPTIQAANYAAPPNILWHNKTTGQDRVWIMSGTNIASEVTLPTTTDDPAWQMAGTGDFDQDGNPDIVWQNQNLGLNGVWYMKGTTYTTSSFIQSAGDPNWRIVGVADFNGDGKPDLVWQNLVTVQNAVWLMNGTAASSYNLIFSNGDPNWRIVATGDLNGDGKPDIVLRNFSTGQNAVWYMNGLTMISSELLHAANGIALAETDQDWRIVGTGDYNGDGKPDLLWRHCTLGLNVTWFLNGSVVTGSTFLGKQEFDTDWKICGQERADSSWRLQTADYTWLRASVSVSPPRIALTFKLVPNSGFGATVQRRSAASTNWTTLISGLQASTYLDAAVSPAQRYEYKVFREGFNGVQYASAEHVSVGLNGPPLEDRGKVILLVDKTLTNQLTASLDQLKGDLASDGWSVVRYDVPRHIDDYSSTTSYRTNAYNVTNVVKPLILSTYKADPTNAKAIFIIGHVPIPYSGSFSVDGHSCGPGFGPDHQGAWAADMFYGDVDGTWTDSSVNYTNCNFAEPLNVPGDGKFDQDGIAPPFVMRLSVGRIDFARLPVFTDTPPPGIAPISEAALLQQYLDKDHRYRLKLLKWQTNNPPERGIVYGHFHDSRDNPIFENAASAAPAITAGTNALTVGDFYLRRNQAYLWGFLSGAGAQDRVNNAMPLIEHTSADLANPANEPTTAFSMVLASFLGDWNLASNNFLRSLLATPNFGLGSMWTRHALWRLDVPGLGEHLGASELHMVNDPKDGFYDRSRDLAILGDPTLRLHILKPPSSLMATLMRGKVQLVWAASESGSQYYVYRSGNADGPFARISASPVTGTSFADYLPSPTQRTYMVRALKTVTVSNGSYTNISQGVVAAAH